MKTKISTLFFIFLAGTLLLSMPFVELARGDVGLSLLAIYDGGVSNNYGFNFGTDGAYLYTKYLLDFECFWLSNSTLKYEITLGANYEYYANYLSLSRTNTYAFCCYGTSDSDLGITKRYTSNGSGVNSLDTNQDGTIFNMQRVPLQPSYDDKYCSIYILDETTYKVLVWDSEINAIVRTHNNYNYGLFPIHKDTHDYFLSNDTHFIIADADTGLFDVTTNFSQNIFTWLSFSDIGISDIVYKNNYIWVGWYNNSDIQNEYGILALSPTDFSITVDNLTGYSMDNDRLQFDISSGDTYIGLFDWDGSNQELELLKIATDTLVGTGFVDEHIGIFSNDDNYLLVKSDGYSFDPSDYWLYETEMEEYEGTEYGDLSDYESLCEGGRGMYMNVAERRYLENRFEVELNADIEAVDLYISYDQFALVSSSNIDYGITINGESFGQPQNMIDDGLGYTLRWTGLSKTLEYEKPVIAFSCTASVTFGTNTYYWYGYGVNMEGGAHRTHNNPVYYVDELYNGIHHNFGLGMCIYYDPAVEPNPEYPDNIALAKSDYEEYDNIVIYGTVSTLAVNNYVKITNESGQVTIQGFGGNGCLIDDYDFQTSYVPYEAGWYNFTLERNSVVEDYVNVTISTLADKTFIVWTEPNPSGINEQFKIKWVYDYATIGESGILFLSYDFPFDEDKLKGVMAADITGNGSRSWSHPFEDILYFYLCRDNETHGYLIGDYEIHYVGAFYINEIHVLYPEIALVQEGDQPPRATQTIYGQHTFPNCNVVIRLNGDVAYEVGDMPVFEVSPVILQSGHWDVDLCLVEDGVYTVLDNTSFIVLEASETQEGVLTTFIIGYIASLDIMTRLILACAIVLMFAFAPLFVVKKLELDKKFNVTIPAWLFAFMAFVGCVINAVVGLWGWEIVFLILTGAGVIFAVLFYTGRTPVAKGGQ